MRPSRNRLSLNRFHRRSLGIAAAALLTVSFLANPAVAPRRNNFRIAWSHYTGWEPWGYAKQSGILQKWAKKYGIGSSSP